MSKKYHIPVEITPPRFEPIGKYSTVEFREDCAGSCKECVRKKCVYGIFKDNYLHISSMKEPEYLYECQSCFRCVQECTRGIFSRVINPEYRILGDDYWRRDIIYVNWYQAHTGKIPVSGAGYRGPFVAPGFESMWTDMSEIVRPTRDGIHGREYISTCFELSRRVTPLKFNEDMTLASDVPEILELPLPLLFRLPDDLVINESIIISAAKAAKVLKTMMFIMPQDYTADLTPYADNLIPSLTKDNYNDHPDLVKKSRAVELTYETGIEKVFPSLRDIKPDLIIIVKIPLNSMSGSRALDLAGTGVDTLYFYADENGNELDSENPIFLKEMIRQVHLKLVENSIRQKINLIFSGGIAMAEYVAKAIICGADAVVADYIILLALECRLCGRCQEGLSCPVKLDEKFDDNWGCRRIVNLIGAWHAQLIELMGAMGIREVRRLRGEVGRSMWFEDLEEKSFGPVFGERKVTGLG